MHGKALGSKKKKAHKIIKRGSMKSLGKNSVFNVIYTCANILFPLITSMYVARILMESGVGRVAYAQNIASYFTTFAALGLPTYGVRKIAQCRDDQVELNRTFSELFLINMISTTVSCVAYIIVVVTIDNSMMTVPLAIASGLAVFFNYLNIDWLYQGEEEYTYITLRSIAVKIVSFVLVVLFVNSASDYVVYALIVSMATGGNYIFNVFHARSFVSLTFSDVRLQKHIKPLIVFACNIFLVSVYSKIDITMLGSMSTDTTVGLYSYAYKITYLLTTVCTSVTAILFPRIIYQYHNSRDEFLMLLSVGQRSVFFLCIPMVAAVVLMAPNIISTLFGSAFIPAASILRIFAPLIIIKSIGDLLGFQLMVATENEKKITIAYAISAVSNILMNTLLIPRFNGNGAAIASITSELIANAYQIILMKKQVSYKIEWKALIQSIISALLACMIAMISTMYITNSILCLVLSVLIGASVYLIANIAFRNAFLLMLLNKANDIIHR